MTTLSQLASAHTTALSLHASLSQFAFETLEPVTKNMYIQMANATQVIIAGLDERKRQLEIRQQTITQQTSMALNPHSLGDRAEFTEEILLSDVTHE